MEIKILLPDDSPEQGILHLKAFIDRAGITGIEQSEIERGPHEDGQMGAGILLNSIATIISAATEPLVELFKCLLTYVENYRTKIIIPTKDGNIILEHGRGMKAEQVQELVVAIQRNIK